MSHSYSLVDVQKHRLKRTTTSRIQRRLLTWYDRVGRDLPWRKTRDPYAIAVSEVMLQQTQVDRVIPKFRTWMQTFPNVQVLASAPLLQVLKLWSGLGYNNRALQLRSMAQIVIREHGGIFPRQREVLKTLPGFGPYTSGAVATFAFKNDLSEVTVEDLLNYFPMRYEDRSNLIQIDELTDGQEASVELYARVAGGFQVGKNRGPKAPPLFIFEITAGDAERTRKPVVVWWFISGKGAYRIVNYPVFADFLVDVEGELAKVSWPATDELRRATVVVLVVMLLLSFVLFSYDVIWQQILRWIGVLRF